MEELVKRLEFLATAKILYQIGLLLGTTGVAMLITGDTFNLALAKSALIIKGVDIAYLIKARFEVRSTLSDLNVKVIKTSDDLKNLKD